MKELTEIYSREFYDIPRMFLASHGGVLFLFDGSFDDAADEYPDNYEVYALPELGPEVLGGS